MFYKKLCATGLMQGSLSEAVSVMVCFHMLLFVLLVSFFVHGEDLLFWGFVLSDFLETSASRAGGHGLFDEGTGEVVEFSTNFSST